MRSIFGECTGNVRSTPTPNDCLRTVNVSRTPAPWRLSTIPSKTWTRRRWSSITWECTRTLSPALNGGRLVRSWRCSRVSITRFIERGPAGRRGMLAHAAALSTTQRGDEQEAEPRGGREDRVQRDAVRRPVGREDLADQVLARDGAPAARIARLPTVVAHEEVRALVNLPRARRRVVQAPVGLDVRLVQLLAVDVDEPALLLSDGLARQADQALDEGAARAAHVLGGARGVEDDDLAPVRVAEVVDE